MTMEETERRRLTTLVEKVIEGRLDDDGWRRFDRALTLVEQSLGTGSDELITGRNELYELYELAKVSARARKGLHESLPAPSGKPAPPQSRDLSVILLRKIGHVPKQERRVDDTA
ncbi:hypothetical protein ACGFIE_21850 [Micromonospora sp. NPDC049275]|uniref:hypothetical protein n=1 Tax=Micromonospora sp. NPDC049275 TaxID=3364268 RepID=UPI003722FA2D